MNMSGFRIVPKMVSFNRCEFAIVLRNGDCRVIATVDFPSDNQMNYNLEAAQEIANILKKRIRKSV